MPTLDPNDPELYWAAGFLEGEGSFCANRGHVRITADQVEPEPLDRLVSLFGGSRFSYDRGRGPVARWSLGAWGDVEPALEALYPLMSKKRQGQIKHALAGRIVRTGHNNRDKVRCKNGHRFDRFWGGRRICSICAREYHREWWAKRKELERVG